MTFERDPKGYHRRLDIEPSATAEEIKSAYRALAKKLHPDLNSSANAKILFQAISEAYAVLADPESRAQYDALQYSRPSPAEQEEIEPICCSRCGKITAQPRSTVFYRVVSIVFLTTRTPIQGIFCSACAKTAALHASFISAIFGWWGFPWGPIWTIGSIIGNARGGHFSKDVDEKLLWYNTLAFLSKGKLTISYALAQQARKATNEEIALNALNLMNQLKKSGASIASTSLKNPWGMQPAIVLSQLLMLGAIPAAIAFLIYSDKDSASRSISLPRAADLSQPTMRSAPSDWIVPEAKTPTCLVPPINGQVLAQTRPFDKDGHIIEIKNGTVGNAIVKVRDVNTAKLAVSFFVAKGSTATIVDLPDGDYRIQYAFGVAFRSDCRSFAQITSASQFPDIESLHSNSGRTRLSYTLFPISNGNVRPQRITSDSFASD